MLFRSQAQRVRAEDAAEDRILDVLIPPPRSEGFGDDRTSGGSDSTARQVFRKKLREGLLDDKEIELEVASAAPQLEVMTPAGMEDMAEQLRGMFSQFSSGKKKARKLRIAEARKLLIDEEAAKLVNEEEIKLQAVTNAEQTASSLSTRSTR